MFPLPQSFQSSGNSQIYGSFPSLNYTDISTTFGLQSFSSQSLSEPLPGIDLNSPEGFRQSIHIVQELLARVQNLARSAMAGIEHAYHPGTNPLQTTADMVALQQAVQTLVEILKQTGVGALPLLTASSEPLTEENLLAMATKSIQVHYERHKQMQENCGVVSNLLSVMDQTGRK